MANLELQSTSDLVARLHRIINDDEAVTSDFEGDTVLLLLRLNIVADEISQTVRQLLTASQ